MNPEICREASAEDIESLMPLLSAFCEHFHYRSSEPKKRADVLDLLAQPQRGRIFLVLDRLNVVGYVVLAFSFSLEYGGRTAFIDEFFIGTAGRGQGLGKQALTFIEGVAREMGLKALLLEAEETNPRAAALYEKAGYFRLDRRLMTLTLDPASGYK